VIIPAEINEKVFHMKVRGREKKREGEGSRWRDGENRMIEKERSTGL
jgi:hypothetical protein